MLETRRFLSLKAGLTRLELLVLIVIAVVLLAVGAGPAYDYLTNGRVTRAVESARALNTLLSQYATDNNGVYPVGEDTAAVGKSEGIALSLLQNNYTPDTSVFSVGSTPKYRGKGGDYSDLTAENIGWDFTAGATNTTGITSSAPDLLPIVYTTGEKVTYPTPSDTGVDLILSGKGPFALEGIAVAYKGGEAKFIKGVPSGTVVSAPGFISPSFKDTAKYTQIRP